MNILRYLSFELSRTCPFVYAHREKCPVGHPERYLYSKGKEKTLDDGVIFSFWSWAREKGFRGIVLWHMYNEPALEISRIRRLMAQMKKKDPFQPFQLTTSLPGDYSDFDIVKVSSYKEGTLGMDNRLETCRGEGKPYKDMPREGLCGRGLGWEVPIDYYGNWNLCCNDWRCEEAIGNILLDDWELLLLHWNEKRKTIRWKDEESYSRLPRMCRSCMDLNPELSKRGGI